MSVYFDYSEKETEYLSKADSMMAALINKAGHIYRPVQNDGIYVSVVDSIIGQQISTSAHNTIRKRIAERFGTLNPERVMSLSDEELQSVGITFKKAGYIKSFTQMVTQKEFDCDSLEMMDDDQVISELVKIKGIGKWTREMILTFAMKRKDILSYGDLAIRRGIMKLYGLDELSENKFHELTDKFSPYRTTRAIYFWAYANPACDFTV